MPICPLCGAVCEDNLCVHCDAVLEPDPPAVRKKVIAQRRVVSSVSSDERDSEAHNLSSSSVSRPEPARNSPPTYNSFSSPLISEKPLDELSLELGATIIDPLSMEAVPAAKMVPVIVRSASPTDNSRLHTPESPVAVKPPFEALQIDSAPVDSLYTEEVNEPPVTTDTQQVGGICTTDETVVLLTDPDAETIEILFPTTTDEPTSQESVAEEFAVVNDSASDESDDTKGDAAEENTDIYAVYDSDAPDTISQESPDEPETAVAAPLEYTPSENKAALAALESPDGDDAIAEAAYIEPAEGDASEIYEVSEAADSDEAQTYIDSSFSAIPAFGGSNTHAELPQSLTSLVSILRNLVLGRFSAAAQEIFSGVGCWQWLLPLQLIGISALALTSRLLLDQTIFQRFSTSLGASALLWCENLIINLILFCLLTRLVGCRQRFSVMLSSALAVTLPLAACTIIAAVTAIFSGVLSLTLLLCGIVGSAFLARNLCQSAGITECRFGKLYCCAALFADILLTAFAASSFI